MDDGRARSVYSASSSSSDVTGDGSISPTIAQNGGPPRRRRVRFIDECGVLDRADIVTSIAFRPSTAPEEKDLLYYNSEDYLAFAHEDYYYRGEREDALLWKRQERYEFEQELNIGWEDLMAYEDFEYYGDERNDFAPGEEERALGESSVIHKVKTSSDLRV